MKKIKILSLFCLVIILCTVNSATAASEYAITITYNAGSSAVVISGKVGGSAGLPVIALINPYSEGETHFSPDALPLVARILTTGENGELSHALALPEDLPEDIYTLYLSSEVYGKFQANFIVFREDSNSFIQAFAAINGASESDMAALLLSNGAALGIDLTQTSETGLAHIAALIWAWRGIGGSYSAAEFSAAYRAAAAVEDFKSGGSLQNAVTSLGGSVAELLNLSNAQQERLHELLWDTDFTKALPEKIYADSFIVAKITACASWAAAKEVTLLYKTELGLSFVDYNKLSDIKQDEVFVEFYKKLPACTTIKSIGDAFDATAAQILKTVQSSSGGNNYGGGSTGGQGAITSSSGGALKPPEGEFPVIREALFPDIKGHFAQAAVEELCEKGIVSGYEDATFRPDNAVSRAEFAKILVLALEISGDAENYFSDVSPEDWFREYVCILAANGVLQGYNGQVMPHRTLTREDAAVMVYRLLGVQPGIQADYADGDDISDYAREAVNTLSQMQLLQGDGTSFYPRKNMTRAEVSVFILRVIGLEASND